MFLGIFAGFSLIVTLRLIERSTARQALRLTERKAEMNRYVLLVALAAWLIEGGVSQAIDDGSPLGQKADYLQRDLLDKHWLDGLYVSIVPNAPAGTKLPHTVNEPGNVIHAGVWTGRYLAGVGYQFAVTGDLGVRDQGGQILRALRILQEVTGKPGLLARGYVKGHGPVAQYERNGNDSKEWHQGQGAYADYRFYSDVSVDNFNAVLYGYAIYYDLAADAEQKKIIAYDVDRLMTHLLDNHCRIIDLDGQPTQWGHIGIDPDPSRADYYNKIYSRRSRAFGRQSAEKMPLRASLMLLPDLLIAHHITGKVRYRDMYRCVIERFKNNPESDFSRRQRTPERAARTNHSSEGQAYEAVYNAIRYEHDPELLKIYRSWLSQLWEANWSEGNPLFTYMTLSLLPLDRSNERGAAGMMSGRDVPHATEGLRLANETLALYPVDRVMRPVMNSIRKDIEISPFRDRDGQRQASKPVPINERPLDNEYAWKGSPYALDGWLKPIVTSMAFACDDPQVAWFADSAGGAYRTLNHGQSWESITTGLKGATIENLVASKDRTFVLWARTNQGVHVSRDGGLSWRIADAGAAPADAQEKVEQPMPDKWLAVAGPVCVRINAANRLERSSDGGKGAEPAMQDWRIPLAKSVFRTPWGIIASGPGGAYQSADARSWKELKLWPEEETGPADYLHAYWMGRYCGFLHADQRQR
ncbi:MAG TPA: hypothetical protein VFG04_20925 [Planctomycetaceae bacterium]|nr:hypothetical protein [Planctomycetaceae bacterium]